MRDALPVALYDPSSVFLLSAIPSNSSSLHESLDDSEDDGADDRKQFPSRASFLSDKGRLIHDIVGSIIYDISASLADEWGERAKAAVSEERI